MDTPAVRHNYTSGSTGERLHYLDFGGSGTPLIAMHGVIGNGWNWYALAAGIGSGHRVLGLDYAGYGESQWSGTHDYNSTRFAADLGAMIDERGVAVVDLIGSSWGALVAIQYAAANPGRVGRLVVVDVEPSFSQGEDELYPRPRTYADMDEVRADVVQGFPNAPEAMVELTAQTGYAPSDGGGFTIKHDPFFFDRWPFRSDDHWERLGQLTCPTLYVHAADSFVSGEVMREMASKTANAEFAEVAPSTHVIPIDNPDGLLEVVRPFLDA